MKSISSLVFRPPYLANFQPLMTLEQRLVALMSNDHPLAARPTICGFATVRLSGGVATEQHRRAAIAQRGDGAHNLRLDIVAQSNSSSSCATSCAATR